MMHVYWFISWGFPILYAVRILTYLAGWKKNFRYTHNPERIRKDVSVIIPFRDEEKFLPGLMADLAGQDYPVLQYEVILVDDHSCDRSAGLVEGFIREHSNFHLCRLDGEEYGKKEALKRGIRKAIGELILTTDGDCRVEKGWIKEMMEAFLIPGVRMVMGGVLPDPVVKLFHRLQCLEYYSLLGVTAGAAGLGKPVLCNAANMAFYRKDYLKFLREVNIPSPSGDDIFLMLWIKKKWPGSIRFCPGRLSVVRTPPEDKVREFLSQRIRWISKSRYYRDPDIILTGLLVYMANLALFISLVTGFLHFQIIWLFLGILVFKSLADAIFLYPVITYYQKRNRLWLLLPLEIIYFVYVSATGPAGTLLPFTWKGRRTGQIRYRKKPMSGNEA